MGGWLMGKIGTSQNGWPVYDDATWKQHAVRFEVEGIGFWAANDDAAVVLGDFIQKYHDTIEPIDLKVTEAPGYDDWSRALRAVRGQTSGYSNHASCTAVDTNATRHPRGVKGTYTAAKRNALAALVKSYDGALRHGEFYTSTIDGMHVEIDADRDEVKRMADQIRAARRKDDNDVNFKDRHTLTETDVEAFDLPRDQIGKTKSFGELVRFPPGVARLRREVQAGNDATQAAVKAVSSQLSRLTTEFTELKAVTNQQAKLITDLITLLKSE